jgi:hypothetical protein
MQVCPSNVYLQLPLKPFRVATYASLEVTKEQLQKADASLVKQLAVSTGGKMLRLQDYIVFYHIYCYYIIYINIGYVHVVSL